MSRVLLKSDLANFQEGLPATGGLEIFEIETQPVDSFPPAGWDVSAPSGSRQFHLGLNDSWALLVCTPVIDRLEIRLPAHSALPDDMIELLAGLARACARSTKARAIRVDPLHPEDDAVSRLAARLGDAPPEDGMVAALPRRHRNVP